MTDHVPNPDPLLSVPQAAEYLGASERFVRRELATGRLASVRLGRLVRIRQSAVEHYIEGATNQGQPWEQD